jgi:hypothetical protein
MRKRVDWRHLRRQSGFLHEQSKTSWKAGPPAVFEDLVSWPMQLDLSKYPSIEFGQALLPPTELIRNDHEADVVALPRRSKRGS